MHISPMKMAEQQRQQMALLAEVKRKILEDFEKREDYDRLTLSKKSKELLGIIVATYNSFPLVLDDNVSDELTLAQYQAIYKSLQKSAVQGVSFVMAVRTMLGLPLPLESTPQEKAVSVEEIKKEAKKVAFRNKDEPWVE